MDLVDRNGNVVEKKARTWGRVGFKIQDQGVRRETFRTASRFDKTMELVCPFGGHAGREGGKKNSGTSKSHEQYGNVYENKGSALHSPPLSGNVFEN